MPDPGKEPAEEDAMGALPPLVTKADDLEAIRTSVVDAASVSGGLWITYLGVLFYLLIAIGSVTHEDIFLERPMKLPFMNVDIPMRGFFLLGPALFLIVHAYVLLHFVMLARKISALDHALVTQIADQHLRAKLRLQLPANIFVQYLAGPSEVRDGVTGVFLWLIALISLVIGPILLLLYFELQFLPYHGEFITWWQRIAVVLDLGLLWLFWPDIALRNWGAASVGRAPMVLVHKIQRLGTIAIMLFLTVGSILLLLLIATFPGERLDHAVSDDMIPGRRGMRTWLTEGPINKATLRTESLFSLSLALPKFDAIYHAKIGGEEKIDHVAQTVAVYGRDFYLANLKLADLRKANLIWSNLTYADLGGANLNNARLDSATLSHAIVSGATLIRADLTEAKLIDTKLAGADLSGAKLIRANLTNANLTDADLTGVDLTDANLTGIDLTGLKLSEVQLAAICVDKGTQVPAGMTIKNCKQP